jgi:hypothetical protein
MEENPPSISQRLRPGSNKQSRFIDASTFRVDASHAALTMRRDGM